MKNQKFILFLQEFRKKLYKNGTTILIKDYFFILYLSIVKDK